MVHVNKAVGIAASCQHNIDGRNTDTLKVPTLSLSMLSGRGLSIKKDSIWFTSSTCETRMRSSQESQIATDHGEVR